MRLGMGTGGIPQIFGAPLGLRWPAQLHDQKFSSHFLPHFQFENISGAVRMTEVWD